MQPISRELALELQARQLAFVAERLRSPRAREDWRQAFAAGLAELLGRPLGELVDPDALVRAARGALSDEALERALRPIGKALLEHGEAALAKDERPLGHYVPERTQKRIEALLEKPGFVNDKLLREILTSDALESVMRDVLYDALKEFSEKVNPFFSEWGLPSLLKKLVPFGFGGGVTKGLESVRTEFDRRLEPEIRKFLQGFARKALESTLELSRQKADTEAFVALRKKLFRFALAQRVRDALGRQSPDRAEELREIALDVEARVIAESREQVLAEVAEALRARAGKTAVEVMLELGVVHVPDAGAIADATFPALSAALSTRAFEGYVAELLGAFYESVAEGAAVPAKAAEGAKVPEPA